MAKKWLVLLAAVVALGGAACGGDDDDGDGSGLGDGGGGGSEACVELVNDCIDSGQVSGNVGPCAEAWTTYLGCDDESCFAENEPIFLGCVDENCPGTLPCFEE